MTTERGAVRLISAVAGVGLAEALEIGVELKLAPGWKTYWRVPGESGIPPVFGWNRSENVAAVSVVWPGPLRFAIAGMQNYGYADHVVFPVRVVLAEPGRPTVLHLHLRYAVCREVCVPEEARLMLRLGRGPATATKHAATIAAFSATAPQPGARLGWRILRAAIIAGKGPGKPRLKLVVEAESAGAPFQAPDLIAESEAGAAGAARYGMARAQLEDEGRRVRFVLPYRPAGAGLQSVPPARLRLRLTLLDGARRGRFAAEARPEP
ncbi:MAG: hypothetical protein KIT16_05540 [Rhodospirillaceae bacterium]|nr:hypothetical protein [Rhodospirillaceae bacterium]